MSYSRRMGVRNVGVKRLPRHLRNEDLPTDTFTPRTYQVELLDSAVKRNTMICMGSSTGRTFIAVMLIKEMAEDVRMPLSEGGKRSICLVDDEKVISEQCQVIQHPSDLRVGSYFLQTSSSDEWKKTVERYEVVVMAAATFLHLLQQGLQTFSQVNLLILDECHLVLQDHPYKYIMTHYTASAQNTRILGLTSNILKEKYSSPDSLEDLIKSLEEALCCVAETSTLVIPERYGVKPQEQVIECPDYEDTTGLNEQMAEILEGAIDFLDECNIEINDELDNRDPTQIPKAALIECHNIMTQLGPWCAASLADMLIAQIEKIEKQKEFVAMHKKFLKLGATTLRMVSKIFEDHFKHAEYSLEELLSYSTPKVRKMLECFNKYHPETDFVIISEEIEDLRSGSDTGLSDDEDNSDFSLSEDEEENDRTKSPSGGKQVHVAVKKLTPETGKLFDPFSAEEEKFLSGIVFVEHQHEAYALNKFIEEVCAWEEQLCFIKSSHITGHAVRSVGKKETKLFKKQEETLRKFRMQELNLLVSTSLLEEGVDVPKCNLVIRFDVPKDYRSYSQSKGRARARDAEYIILIEEENFDEFESQLKMYRNIEQVLIGQCRDPEDVSSNKNEDNSSGDELPPYIPTNAEGAPQVTLTTAITLVNRYCAKLPSDAFTHLTPSCTVGEINTDQGTKYAASLRLPINSPIKQEIQGVLMSTRLKAKQAVALKMCEILHNNGELDDSLMPVGKEMFQHEEADIEWEDEEDVLGEARPGTTKRKQYYAKKIASALLQSHPLNDVSCILYLFNMKLTGAITDEQNTRGRRIYAPEDTPRGFGLLTAKNIPLVPSFPVYTRSGEVSVSIVIVKSDLVMTETQLDRLKIFHRYLFANVLRLEKDPMDYIPEEAVLGYLIVPVNSEGTADIEIDWRFIDKVEESVLAETQEKPARSDDYMFIFKKEEYEDAVVMPSYRNIDQPQHFYVAEIRYDLNPLSSFPSPELYKTFCAYYTTKYGLAITNMGQPLLDVDHTSARLNLLIPRYMNQKGVALPTSSAETKKARRENLQQKQILVPELCDVHVFPASLWRKAVCLPAILYRMNYLLLAEEIRKHIASETNIGIVVLPKDFRFPQLDFGFDTSPENLKSSNEGATKTESEDKSLEKHWGNEVLEEKSNTLERGEISVSKIVNANNGFKECDTEVGEEHSSPSGLTEGIYEVELGTSICTETFVQENHDMSKKQVETEYLPETGANRVKEIDLFAETSICLMTHKGNNIHESNNQSVGFETDKADIACDKIPLCAITNLCSSKIAFHSSEKTSVDYSNKACNSDCQNFNPPSVNILFEKEVKMLDAEQIKHCLCPDSKLQLLNGLTEQSATESDVNQEFKVSVSDRDMLDTKRKWKGRNESGLHNCHDSVLQEKINPAILLEQSTGADIKGDKSTTEVSVSNLASDLKNLNVNVTILNQEEPSSSSWPKTDKTTYQDTGTEYWEVKNNIKELPKTNDKNWSQQNDEKQDLIHVPEKVNSKELGSKMQTNEELEIINGSERNEEIEDVSYFRENDAEETASESDEFPEPLISLDEDIDLTMYIGPSPCFILQAFTMSNANDFFSLERLETIGDSFLKYAITVYLYCSYPGIHEGKLSYLRSKQVSNYNLYRLGKRKGLAECMISTKFEPYENWLPPGFVINEDKRKGPVPKVLIAQKLNIKGSSAIFSSECQEQLCSAILHAGNDSGPNKVSEMQKFNAELEEAAQISQAEELEQGDKYDNQNVLTPYSLQLHHSIPDKSIADCVEALIGCYLTSCGKMAALRFMSWMGLKVLPRKKTDRISDDEEIEDEFERLQCPQSPLFPTSEAAQNILKHQLNGYEKFEQRIGYKFQDRSYLLQAFTHASYHYNTVTDCYQRLEFLGDAILDYVITRHLYEDSDKYSPGVLTDLRSALVNNNIFAALAVKWDFHKYFKAISPVLFSVIEKFVMRQKEKEDEIDLEDEEGDEDLDKERVELEVPKALGDIFESVAGAIYLDSGMSLDVVWRVFYRIMKPQIDKYLKSIPKSPVRELLEQEPETAKFEKPERTMDGKIRVTVNVVGKGVFSGVGRNYRIAKSAAAKKALRCIKTLEQQGLI